MCRWFVISVLSPDLKIGVIMAMVLLIMLVIGSASGSLCFLRNMLSKPYTSFALEFLRETMRRLTVTLETSRKEKLDSPPATGGRSTEPMLDLGARASTESIK